MGETMRLHTDFAPPGRAEPTAIAADVRHFESFELVQELFAAVPDPYVVLNEERQIIFANQAFLDVIGADNVQQIAGSRPGEAVHCVHAAEYEAGCGTTEFCQECGAVRAILQSQRGRESKQECRILCSDGSALDLQVRTRPLHLEGRNFTQFAVVDISHEKRRRALERIFFHDILNMAGGMVGIAELLRMGDTEDLEDCREAVYLLSLGLVEEIKAQQTLSAAEIGELVVEPGRINAVTLLYEVLNIYLNHEVSMDRRLQVSDEAESVIFTSDKTLVRRVIGNMVKNTLEAARPGQTVTMSCRQLEHEVEFSVHNPVVMPKDVQLQIFQRSFSTKGSGRGLGTYSMKLLTERFLHGSVAFTSTEGTGTIFFARYSLEWPEPEL